MSKVAENGTEKITIEYDTDKADALRMHLQEMNKTLEGELGLTVDVLYNKNVNPRLKQYIEYKKQHAVKA